jgi:hypothetical protein
MIQLLLFKDCGGQDDPLTALLNSCPQKQGLQVLFHRARADVEFRCDLLIAAALHQELENFLISARNLDLL